jgi:ubiquinone biosynthesis protein COQ9
MKSPLAEAERDRLIEAMLPDIAFEGWTRAAVHAGARNAGLRLPEALALFPGGAADLVGCFSRWADRHMLDRLEAAPLDGLRTHERIARAIAIRLEILQPWREAVRRGLTVLALPQNVPLALRLLYETVDAIWYAAGDSATDFSFYTKRASLAAVHTATMLYWLEDRSEGFADTRAFLDRRLGDLAWIGRMRADLARVAERLPDPLRLLRRSR